MKTLKGIQIICNLFEKCCLRVSRSTRKKKLTLLFSIWTILFNLEIHRTLIRFFVDLTFVGMVSLLITLYTSASYILIVTILLNDTLFTFTWKKMISGWREEKMIIKLLYVGGKVYVYCKAYRMSEHFARNRENKHWGYQQRETDLSRGMGKSQKQKDGI